MKKKIHPAYQEVLFVDSSNGTKFVCGSTLKPKETEEYEGKEYPVCRVAVSASSHPFFTKSRQFIDTEGRVDKFTKKYAKKREQEQKKQEKQKEAEEKKKPKKRAKKASS